VVANVLATRPLRTEVTEADIGPEPFGSLLRGSAFIIVASICRSITPPEVLGSACRSR